MLSFREQAAIAMATAMHPDGRMSAPAAAEQAQSLATACCKAWGHQFSGEIHDESECERCGLNYLAIPLEE